MGLSSWICPKCGKPIYYGEVIHMRHIRHGKVLGETVGYYNGYGNAFGDFTPNDHLWGIDKEDLPSGKADYQNTDEELCISEFELSDSIGYEARIYEGKNYTWEAFRVLMGYNDFEVTPPESFYALWESLLVYEVKDIKSGISAYHEKCYKQLSDAEKSNNIISKRPDSNADTVF